MTQFKQPLNPANAPFVESTPGPSSEDSLKNLVQMREGDANRALQRQAAQMEMEKQQQELEIRRQEAELERQLRMEEFAQNQELEREKLQGQMSLKEMELGQQQRQFEIEQENVTGRFQQEQERLKEAEAWQKEQAEKKMAWDQRQAEMEMRIAANKAKVDAQITRLEEEGLQEEAVVAEKGSTARSREEKRLKGEQAKYERQLTSLETARMFMDGYFNVDPNKEGSLGFQVIDQMDQIAASEAAVVQAVGAGVVNGVTDLATALGGEDMDDVLARFTGEESGIYYDSEKTGLPGPQWMSWSFGPATAATDQLLRFGTVGPEKLEQIDRAVGTIATEVATAAGGDEVVQAQVADLYKGMVVSLLSGDEEGASQAYSQIAAMEGVNLMAIDKSFASMETYGRQSIAEMQEMMAGLEVEGQSFTKEDRKKAEGVQKFMMAVAQRARGLRDGEGKALLKNYQQKALDKAGQEEALVDALAAFVGVDSKTEVVRLLTDNDTTNDPPELMEKLERLDPRVKEHILKVSLPLVAAKMDQLAEGYVPGLPMDVEVVKDYLESFDSTLAKRMDEITRAETAKKMEIKGKTRKRKAEIQDDYAAFLEEQLNKTYEDE